MDELTKPLQKLEALQPTSLLGSPASTPEEAVLVAEALGGSLWVVRCANSKGCAFGEVYLAKSLSEVRQLASHLLATPKTDLDSDLDLTLYIEGASMFSFGMGVDPEQSRFVLRVSAEVGADLDTVALNTPDRVHSVALDPTVGYSAYQGRQLASRLGLPSKLLALAGVSFGQLFSAYIVKDDLLRVDINPLILSHSGECWGI